ncbi:MAG: hypothetical protein ACK4IS_07905 [Erythrobacter sp.]
MSEAERARIDAEGRQRAWERLAELPGPRTAAALRLLLGLSPSRAALLAGLPEHVVTDFERTQPGGFPSHAIARRLHQTYARLGASWCAPDLDDGAYFVALATPRGAGDRQAIEAALALMGRRATPPRYRVGLDTLARRIAGRLAISPAAVRAELEGRAKLSKWVRAEAFRQLGRGSGGAGAYFRPADAGGWRLVGADVAGCWW